jgi:hypothetical protein
MCCNTKGGPRAVSELIGLAYGAPVNQQDWHLLRRRTAEFLGEPLRRDIMPTDEAASVARDFYDWVHSQASAPLPPRERWVAEFTSHKNTSGTLHVLDHITIYGLPEAVAERPRRRRSPR